jgi:hypothetical protein
VPVSWMLDDGLLGLTAIRGRGGTTVARDPDDGSFMDERVQATVLSEFS